jgi:hypothetical protein
MQTRSTMIPAATRRRRKPTAQEREARLRDLIVEALHWLDCQAPGRAHVALTESLRENTEAQS